MDFSLTEKQEMLKKITREFAEEYLIPVAQESGRNCFSKNERNELFWNMYSRRIRWCWTP